MFFDRINSKLMFRHTHINTNKFYMHKESLIYAQIQINNVYKAHT
jgi:hypothetical protein